MFDDTQTDLYFNGSLLDKQRNLFGFDYADTLFRHLVMIKWVCLFARKSVFEDLRMIFAFVVRIGHGFVMMRLINKTKPIVWRLFFT